MRYGSASPRAIVRDSFTATSGRATGRSKVLAEGQHRPVGKSEGQTNHVERWNGTLRQRLGRFVRKTLSFSKSDSMHEICLVLFLHDYNRLCLNNTR